MPNGLKGAIAGFLATVVMSAIFVLTNSMNILPQLDIVGMIDHLGSIQRTAAWVDHFIVGALLWGPIFAAFDDSTAATRPRWQKGLIFGVIAWVAMMLIFMPTIGAGLFGWRMGLGEPIGMLALHLVFGFALGVFFQILDRLFPAKPLVPAVSH